MLSMVVCLEIFDGMTSVANFKLKIMGGHSDWQQNRPVIQNLQSYKAIDMKEAKQQVAAQKKLSAASGYGLQIRIPKGIIALVYIKYYPPWN